MKEFDEEWSGYVMLWALGSAVMLSCWARWVNSNNFTVSDHFNKSTFPIVFRGYEALFGYCRRHGIDIRHRKEW